MSRWSSVFVWMFPALIPVIASAQQLTQQQLRLLSRRAVIEKIVIQGNQTYSTDEIKKRLYSKEPGFWHSLGLKKAPTYGKANLRHDRALLEYFYRSRGFMDFNFDSDFQGDPDLKRVTVRYNLKEGQRYHIGKVSITGELGSLAHSVYVAAGALKTGDYLNSFAFEDAQRRIKAVFANHGYPYAQVKATLERNLVDSTADLDFPITRGPLVVFGYVIVDSNLTTARKVYDMEVDFKYGQTYSRDKLLLSQQRLIATNLFNYVSLETADSMSQQDSLMPNIYVRGVERPPRYINLATGAGQDQQKGLVGTLQAAAGNRSIKGKARKVRLEATTSAEVVTDWQVIKARFQFSYTEPYLFRIRMPIQLSLAYEPRLPSLVQDYDLESIILQVSALREISLTSRLLIAGGYEQYNISGIQPEDELAFRDEQGISRNRKLSVQLDRDSRPIEEKLNPSSGSYTQYQAQLVGGILGGDHNFYKLQFSWSKYNKFFSHGAFASRIRLGLINNFSESKFVPSKDRFYLGGSYTIRGFEENKVGPLSDGSAEGGEAIALLNLELRHPLFWKIWGSLFFDSGQNVRNLSLLGWREMVYSVGAGIQPMFIVGPIRFDYGWRLGINGVDPGGRLHISILYAF